MHKINKATSAYYFHRLREIITLECQNDAVLSGEFEVDESYFGDPRVASDGTGALVWSWNSDAFGNGAPSGTATVNLRMAGQDFDDESGLHYNWNRYYDPETGRYVSSDPIGRIVIKNAILNPS